MAAIPFIPEVNTLKTEHIFDFNGQICENVFHWRYSTDPSQSDATSLAAAIVAWWNASGKTVSTPQVSLQRVKLTNMTTQTGFSFEYTTGLPVGGTVGQPSLPNNCALVIKWTTGNRGRSFRGRTYHMGLDEYNTSNNAVTAAYAGLVATAYANYLALVATPQPTLVVASRFSNNLPRTTALLTPVTGLSVETIVDSQRRRLPGRGS